MAKDEIDWLKKQISNNTERLKLQAEGEAYYYQENTAILERTKTYYNSDGNLVEDPYLSNHKLPAGFMTVVVDQKVSYSINNSMVATIGEGEASKPLNDILGRKWRDELADVATEASKKGFGVWQIYLDDSGQPKYKNIPPEQVVLCRNGDGVVVKVARVYEGLSEDGTVINKAEIWDKDTVIKYEKETAEEWICVCDATPHLMEVTSFGDVVDDETGKGWGKPPFVIFENNKRCKTDLEPIKAHIDAYDFVMSDFANNLEDFQENWWVIKNYSGQNIKEFFENFKMNKAIKVGEDGDVKREQQEISFEAKQAFGMDIKRDTYEKSMSVDTNNIEGNVTNVQIRSMYAGLDMKATKFERRTTEFLGDLGYFFGYDEDDLYITYDRNLVINVVETTTIANQSKGLLSEETRLGMYPQVEDVKEEIKRMEKQGDPESDLV